MSDEKVEPNPVSEHPDEAVLLVNQRTERVRVTKVWEVDAEVEDSVRADGKGIRCSGWLANVESLMSEVDASDRYTLIIERLAEGVS